MNELIKIAANEDGVFRVESRLIAKELAVEHASLMRLLVTHLETIESNFGMVGFEILPRLEGQHGGGETRIAHLTEDQALFVGSLSRNTVEVVKFKAKLVKSFLEAKKATQQVLPQTTGQILLQMVTAFAENEARQLKLEAKMNELEAKQATINTEYYTVAGYASLLGKSIDTHRANLLGRACVKLSQNLDYEIGKVYNAQYGQINSYHIEVLQEIFSAHSVV